MDTSPSHEIDVDRLSIRMATPADQAAIQALYNESLSEGAIPGNDTGADIENLTVGYLAEDGESGFWVAEYDGTIIGMVGALRTAENRAELRRLRVCDPFRRKGIGTMLLREALTFCAHHGYLKVILDVRIEGAPAIAMFEKFGFKHSRTRNVDGRELLDFYLDLYEDADG